MTAPPLAAWTGVPTGADRSTPLWTPENPRIHVYPESGGTQAEPPGFVTRPQLPGSPGAKEIEPAAPGELASTRWTTGFQEIDSRTPPGTTTHVPEGSGSSGPTLNRSLNSESMMV